MEFRAVEKDIGGNKRPIKHILIVRGRTVDLTILVVIMGLEGDDEVYSYKRDRVIGGNRGKRIFIYIILILPD